LFVSRPAKDDVFWAEPICFVLLSDFWKHEILTPRGEVLGSDGMSWATYDEFVKEVTTPKMPGANLVQTTMADRAAEVFGT
jgi:hypothetical protein